MQGVYLSDKCASIVHIMFSIRMVISGYSDKNTQDKSSQKALLEQNLSLKFQQRDTIFLHMCLFFSLGSSVGRPCMQRDHIYCVLFSSFFWSIGAILQGKKENWGWGEWPLSFLLKGFKLISLPWVLWRLLRNLWLVHATSASLCFLCSAEEISHWGEWCPDVVLGEISKGIATPSLSLGHGLPGMLGVGNLRGAFQKWPALCVFSAEEDHRRSTSGNPPRGNPVTFSNGFSQGAHGSDAQWALLIILKCHPEMWAGCCSGESLQPLKLPLHLLGKWANALSVVLVLLLY